MATLSINTVTGYDGNGYAIGDRVEIHPGTDLWISGARYGTVIGIRPSAVAHRRVHVEMDRIPTRKFYGSEDMFRAVV